jgi:hypothetical protein
VNDLIHETVFLRTAYGDLVWHVCKPGVNPDTVPLTDVLAGLDELGDHRAAALLYVARHGDTVEKCQPIVRELRRWLEAGRRPRLLREVLDPEERAAVERAFARHMTAAQPWWKRLRERVARAFIADDEMSERMDRADRERRVREGKMP